MKNLSDNTVRLSALAAVILFAALYRVLPHPPNIAPVAAMALFAGAHFRDWRIALAAPISAMLISDFLIGLHSTLIFVYAGMAATVGIGCLLRRHYNGSTIIVGSLASSTLFYLITNFGSWLGSPFYTQNASGLFSAYIAGIPFYQYSVIGDLAFAGIFFGAYNLAARHGTRTKASSL
ncbi:conserved hypothetical protein [gamma proteobacterium HTCC5015]|nr:conserved hypothetical protein [gamma proteobacterium HTCC5015]